MSDFIRFFDEDGPAGIERLGGKCASLVALTRAGMPVPPGFAVTTEAYTAFVELSGVADEIHAALASIDHDDVAHVDEVSARIREAMMARAVPAPVQADFDAAYAALQSRFVQPQPVAVRSSATAEDLPDASFAGQQDTYLWLNGRDAVAHHVRKCWASLYTSRAIVYRLRNGIPNEGLSMAVAVQKMVDAKAAGVAMTIDPANGDRSTIVIDAAWGLGELVVSGLVTPDNLHVDKVMLAVSEEHIGDKHIELVPDGAGGIEEREVEPDRRGVRCLTDAEVRRIAEIAKRAEKHFGAPQDIEWAIDRGLPEGEDLLLLQSRPETVWGARSSEAPATTTSGFGIASITKSLMAQVGR